MSFIVTRVVIVMLLSHFLTRAAEHLGISNLTGKRVKNVKESAISDHLLQYSYVTSESWISF